MGNEEGYEGCFTYPFFVCKSGKISVNKNILFDKKRLFVG